MYAITKIACPELVDVSGVDASSATLTLTVCLCVPRRNVSDSRVHAGGRAVQLPYLLSAASQSVGDGRQAGNVQRHEGNPGHPDDVS